MVKITDQTETKEEELIPSIDFGDAPPTMDPIPFSQFPVMDFGDGSSPAMEPTPILQCPAHNNMANQYDDQEEYLSPLDLVPFLSSKPTVTVPGASLNAFSSTTSNNAGFNPSYPIPQPSFPMVQGGIDSSQQMQFPNYGSHNYVGPWIQEPANPQVAPYNNQATMFPSGGTFQSQAPLIDPNVQWVDPNVQWVDPNVQMRPPEQSLPSNLQSAYRGLVLGSTPGTVQFGTGPNAPQIAIDPPAPTTSARADQQGWVNLVPERTAPGNNQPLNLSRKRRRYD